MPPGLGTGKKLGGAMARQRSRNTTPSNMAAAAAAAGASSSSSSAAAAGGAASSSVPPAPPVATASLPPITGQDLEYLELRFEVFGSLAYDDLVDAGAGTGTSIPDSRSIDGIVARLKRLQGIADDRGSSYDRGMRLLSQSRRTRMDEAAAERSREEERLQRAGLPTDEDHQRRANKKKRKAPPDAAAAAAAASTADAGASQASGDMEVDEKVKPEDDKKKANNSGGGGTTTAAAAAADDDDDGSSSSSESTDDGAPPPRPVPANQTFGEDPSTFPDPTVYEIRPVQPGMTVDEIKAIYSVASYPPSDLADLIAGNPPDKDFSSAKPSNQINFSTFSSYIEPYFRPFTEEDLAFLRERGDRVTPFVMPKRGKRHYTEIWAEEDGAMALDGSPSPNVHNSGGGGGVNGNSHGNGASSSSASSNLPPNQPRGSIEAMSDDVAETATLSVGPLLARLLQALRPERRPPPAPSSGDGAGGLPNGSGDVTMHGSDAGGFLESSQTSNGVNGVANGADGEGETSNKALPPATFLPESAAESWRKATHPKLDYNQVDERIKQELRHVGFLPFPDPSNGPVANGAGVGTAAAATTNGDVVDGVGAGAGAGATVNGTNGVGSANGAANGATISTTTTNGSVDPAAAAAAAAAAADYDGHFDDEIAARLRRLQTALREQVLVNGARKARLAELVKERMAYQEYQTILEDLDGQVQAAYLKRTRTMGKTKKGKRPGAGAAGAGGAGGGAGAAGGAGAGAGGAGTARPGIGDLTRTLMERRKRWIENIGAVFDDARLGRGPRAPEEMGALVKREKAAWDEEVEEE
ncbi:transcriptional regulator [Niveomyces insectorum RCEF 264]|uniref:Transcriptional regulator n=1 Tax=Niveomyces insectorum RCEF 264 TaxID=1081102 RepID=A0A162J213_9HYPO|nr:transcriptional regulator [Niveomyces insectorum RCEF 264]